ncbi:hypothetical protein SYNPS1DRAFT_20664 [Syncephalis pseudoplumigaleata]|uniref:RRM domain-containing protein n=1 Tax=Syncephalis pseudoplumigaleata TaxID=1712513 RepID=A0A4P9Z7R1_9FUNG|nr:hypothetical protein SYNPS1DRAFT_20664 [Syncephalis pseudoplumigaleata]|eukprot:RKP27951.1 hypothetical protein SYNPS1DRAFT_20664 [Syncephalis pseudoplumigaleata]
MLIHAAYSLVATRSEGQLRGSVYSHFSQWGELLDVKVFRDWQQRPYSFVQFESKEAAMVALQESKGSLIDGRPIRVEPARVNRALFIVHKEAREITEQEIRQLIRSYGEIETLEILPWSANNQERGLAFVKFCYRDDAIQAYLGVRTSRTWCVDWANHAERLVHPNDKTSLFVGQLNPQEITEDKLYARFERYGSIAELALINRMAPRACQCISVQYREPREHLVYRRASRGIIPSSVHPFPTTVGRFRHPLAEEPAISMPAYTLPPPSGPTPLSPLGYASPIENYYYPCLPAFTGAPPAFYTSGQLPQPSDGLPVYVYPPHPAVVTPVPYHHQQQHVPPPGDGAHSVNTPTPESRHAYKLPTPQSSDQSANTTPSKPALPTSEPAAGTAAQALSDICYHMSGMHVASRTSV